VPGGQTLNPSTEEIVKALQAAEAQQYVILPNNPNVTLAARQAASIVDRPVALVPTRNLAEGVAAAVAYEPGRLATENANAMARSLEGVRTGMVTDAVRAAVVDNRAICPGDVLGLINDRVDVVGADIVDVSLAILRSLRGDSAEIVTAYVGEGVSPATTETLRARVVDEIRPQKVEIVHGGQPYYRLILACE
jgi:dihydroxyacetone kinase-like predicted kinase